MSLEAALEANTAAVLELAGLLKKGYMQDLVIDQQAAVVRGHSADDATAKEIAGKKSVTGQTAPATSAQSGEPSAPTPEKSSAAPAPTELQPWAEACAETYASLKDGDGSLDNVKTAILAINSKIGREQANAVLARFGAQAVTAKADKRGLDPEQYADFFALCLDVLAGRVDATASLPTEA
ncbi:hypothetical protein [Burkholderia anthina]|uniref:hypothetical protein n=1 Tax=Burkholderia anthina TaxID=179879 RepID=UPI001AA02541|nr:hypothetical protein [Burkholderia anthina]QTD88905.1 hypothetical protein J4G50_13920 [Burkholderia anthina]